MIEGNVYWVGKCEVCPYHRDFGSTYGLYWFCAKYNRPMFTIKKCDGPYVATEENKKFNLEVD